MREAKKPISIMLSLIMVLSFFTTVPFTAEAVKADMVSTQASSGDYEYAVLKDGTAEITKYNGGNKNAELEIPSKLDGYTVTSIGFKAFSDCRKLTSVTIPDSVTSIGEGSFLGCTSLKSVIIPNSVTSISGYAFLDCESLTNATIPDSITSIGGCAFDDCRGLSNITLPDSLTYIGHHAFRNTGYYNDSSNWFNGALYFDNYLIDTDDEIVIGDYKIKDGTKLIADGAFSHCSSLTGITIPDSITSISNYAFEACTSLKSVTIPSSVTNIGGGAFEICTGLENITIPSSVTRIGYGAFYYCTSLKSITIPGSITSLSNSAFSYCESLESVTIENGLKEICYGAFEKCTSLTSVTLPDSVTRISHGAFWDTGLFDDYTYWDRGVLYIGDYLIAADSEAYIFNCNVKDGTKLIADGAFWYCPRIESLTIPDSVTSIGEYAFYRCISLKSVTIGKGVERIAANAFEYCESLTSITIPDSVKNIDKNAFYYCQSLKSVTIPTSVTSIGERAFYDCSSLKSVTIPSSVTCIGEKALGYNYAQDEWNNPIIVKTEDYKIIGTSGSEAERYATTNGFEFVNIEEAPTEAPSSEPTETPTAEPTITQPTAPPQTPTKNPVVAEAGYYLVGQIGGKSLWSVEDLTTERLFEANPVSDGEYMLDYTFTEGDEIKVVHFDGTDIDMWYNSGIDTYKIDAKEAGECTIYFNPEGNSEWSYKYFIVVPKTPVTETPPTPDEPTAEPTDAPIDAPTDAPSAAVLGDADGNGVVDILDATVIQRKLARLELKSFSEKGADIDLDGKISITDATIIQRYLAELCNLDGSTPYTEA